MEMFRVYYPRYRSRFVGSAARRRWWFVDEHRPVVPRIAQATVAAARLAIRPGMDVDPRPCCMAAVLAWNGTSDPDAHRLIITLYAINFVCHFAWSPLFFTLKRPDIALIEVVFLWSSVLSLCILLRPYSV